MLVAEDNAADARLIREALQLHGVEGEMLVAPDGELAIEVIRSLDAGENLKRPHLVIVDLNLPRKTGREVLEDLRLRPKLCDLPVVVLTSSEADSDRADVARLGAARYLRKPLRLEEFLELGVIFKDLIDVSRNVR